MIILDVCIEVGLNEPKNCTHL